MSKRVMNPGCILSPLPAVLVSCVSYNKRLLAIKTSAKMEINHVDTFRKHS